MPFTVPLENSREEIEGGITLTGDTSRPGPSEPGGWGAAAPPIILPCIFFLRNENVKKVKDKDLKVMNIIPKIISPILQYIRGPAKNKTEKNQFDGSDNHGTWN